jgi:hypothetical protein
MRKKKHDAPLLQKYHKTDLMDSKELQAFLWTPGLHGYKLAHECEPLRKTQFGSLQPLATFAEKTSFDGFLTLLPSHEIPLKPCIPSRHMAIKPQCHCSQLLFPARASSMCLMQQRQQSQANVDTNKHPHTRRARNANTMRHY